MGGYFARPTAESAVRCHAEREVKVTDLTVKLDELTRTSAELQATLDTQEPGSISA